MKPGASAVELIAPGQKGRIYDRVAKSAGVRWRSCTMSGEAQARRVVTRIDVSKLASARRPKRTFTKVTNFILNLSWFFDECMPAGALAPPRAAPPRAPSP